MPVEIATRWGDTLLDVAHVEDFTLVDVQLVKDGVLVAAPAGRVGCIDYTATAIETPRRTIRFARDGDRRWVPYVASALLVHLAVWRVAALETPVREPAKPERPKIARIASAPAHAYAPPDDRARDRVDDVKSQGQGIASLGPEGAAGARSPKLRGHIAVKNTGEVPQLSKAEAVARARDAGVLGSAQVLLEGYTTLGGTERLTSAFDAMDLPAPLTRDAGTASGAFGLGRTYDGTSGGGTQYGTIGTGTTGTFSSGTTHGHGWGGSRAPRPQTWVPWDGGPYFYVGSKRRRIKTPSVQICPKRASPCEVEGVLEPAVVRRHVKRNIHKLAYCYEKELLAKPKLRGQLDIAFAVSGDGRVEVVRTSGFDDNITACTRGVFEKIELPPGATFVAYVLRFEIPA